ncbi:vacuolar ATPase assembly protein VMA22-like isoform X2 [Babylonia areolata]|uniref:vacuolar ATPase assembly protein VMA22-like isoform X2 n=1 Tax=Babylonia areolata TaxID=304850 RepID=UPI003FD14567
MVPFNSAHRDISTAMESSSDLTSVCQSLDQVTLEFFDTLESLYQSQARLEALMRSGFLSMSRARYSMGGTRNVGALQFAKNEMEMEAASVVDVTTGEDKCSDDAGDGPSWTSIDISLVQKQTGATKNIDNQKTKQSDHLRQRKGQNEKDQKKVETVGMQKIADENKDGAISREPRRLQDPLTLFGVLVSPHLRQCQSFFKQSVEIVVEIANLKNRLQGLQAKFQQLMAQKKTLVAT